MGLISIPIARYNAEFRLLTWKEQHNIIRSNVGGYQKDFLSRALVRVDGVDVKTLDEAKKVLSILPKSFINKLWVLYSAELPPIPFYTTRGLYTAPPPQNVARKYEEATVATDTAVEKALKNAEAKYGPEDIKRTQSIERKILDASKKRGLQPATQGDV